MPTLGDKNVRRLDVTVDNAFCVRGSKGIGNLDRQTEQHIRVQRPPRDAVFKRSALQKLHRDKGLLATFANIVDRADVGMIEGGGSASFTPEAF